MILSAQQEGAHLLLFAKSVNSYKHANPEPGLYDPRRKLELCGDDVFVMPCGQSFVDVDPGCHESGIVCILKQRKAFAEEEMKQIVPDNIASRVRHTAFWYSCKIIQG